jgi:inorganic pyrophosphatase/exopolyphosphatase
MNDLKIITAGPAYIDIDVLACSIAYQELLLALGYQVLSCHTGPFNNTISRSLQERATPFIMRTPPKDLNQSSFILVDVSDPQHFEKFVDINRIEKIFDHHFGYNDFWQERLGDDANIVSIGACATLIWQEFQKVGYSNISPFAAELLATAILSNTLSLKASITTEADCKALAILEKRAHFSSTWRQDYYQGTYNLFLQCPEQAILSDTKNVQVFGQTIFFCQIETWEPLYLMKQIPFNRICETLFKGYKWVLNVINISQGYNYILTNTSQLFTSYNGFYLDPKEKYFSSKKLWLRKEILKLWQTNAQESNINA